MGDRIRRFFEGMRGKRVSVVGVGVTNTGVILQMCAKGALVTAHDRRAREELGSVCGDLERAGARLALGEDYLRDVDCDVLFRTPGMYFKSDFMAEMRAKGVVVTSEMEVFFDLCPCPVIAVTGSDGKTTTTALIARILEAAGYTVHLGGNIGRALLPEIESVSPRDMAVVELSSFQLISMRCAPDVSVVTNVAPNHLDVHRDMEEYVDAKRHIYLHQNAFSKTVLNLDNEVARSFSEGVRGRLYHFSRRERVQFGAYLGGDGVIYLNTRGKSAPVIRCADILLPGAHNIENFLAAIAAVSDYADQRAVEEAAKTFRGVEHRIEFVRELNGVRWYNDSIATSPTRTIAGLNAFDQKLILIAGGYDKKIPFLALAPEIISRVKTLILTGATADLIEEAVTRHPAHQPGTPAILRARDMEDAVLKARAAARAGDIVSLSPASASFDCYPNFEKRGRHYKSLVNGL